MAVHRRDIKLLSQLMHGEIIRNDRSFFEQSKSQHSAIDRRGRALVRAEITANRLVQDAGHTVELYELIRSGSSWGLGLLPRCLLWLHD